MKHTKIILASASPRRVELLQQIQVEFEQQAVDIDECWRHGEDPETFVSRLALEKAQAVVQGTTPVPVLGSDTIVVIDSTILGKPTDIDDAARMLTLLSGKTHQVMTAVTLNYLQQTVTRLSISDVTFGDITNNEIKAYCETGESLGKAGAYAIQGMAAQFIREIRGSYSGIMGLPLYETRQLLLEFNVDVLGSRH